MEEDEEVADSGGDSNTSTCEREVIERLFGGFVEDIIFIFFLLVCALMAKKMDQEICRGISIRQCREFQQLCELLVAAELYERRREQDVCR